MLEHWASDRGLRPRSSNIFLKRLLASLCESGFHPAFRLSNSPARFDQLDADGIVVGCVRILLNAAMPDLGNCQRGGNRSSGVTLRLTLSAP